MLGDFFNQLLFATNSQSKPKQMKGRNNILNISYGHYVSGGRHFPRPMSSCF